MPQPPTTALVVDTHSLSAAGILHVVGQISGIDEAHIVPDTNSLCSALSGRNDLTLLVVDPAVTGLDGLNGVRSIRQSHPAVKVVLISDSADVGSVFDALAAGAHGYISKSQPVAEMVDALNMVMEGHVYVPDYVADAPGRAPTHAADAPHHPQITLTARQQQVLEQLQRGSTNKEIANALRISESTVKVHLVSVFRALKVQNRLSAVAAVTELYSHNGNVKVQ